jgi:hypothetical protein
LGWQKQGKGAAFAKPQIGEALEERGVKYAICIPSYGCLERDIALPVWLGSIMEIRAPG